MYDKAKELIIKAKTNIFNTNLGNQLFLNLLSLIDADQI